MREFHRERIEGVDDAKDLRDEVHSRMTLWVGLVLGFGPEDEKIPTPLALRLVVDVSGTDFCLCLRRCNGFV